MPLKKKRVIQFKTGRQRAVISQEEMCMADTERYSTSFVILKVAIKTALRTLRLA